MKGRPTVIAPASLSLLQADALRELCNVCGGQAADALSALIGDARVNVSLPEAERVDVATVTERLGGAHAPLVAARVELAGPLQGELWLTLPAADAAELSGLLDDRERGPRLAPWALYETANILASACLNGLYALTRLTVVPGVPEVTEASAGETVARIAQGGDALYVLSTELLVRDAPVRGRILFLLREASLLPLLAALGLPGDA